MEVNTAHTVELPVDEEGLEHALSMRLNALKINKALGSDAGMAEDYHHLGIFHALRGHLEKAERLLNRAMQLEREMDRPELLADCCYNLATVYAASGKGGMADRYYGKALSMDRASGNTAAQIYTHLAVALLQLQKGHDREAALKHLNTALKMLSRGEADRPELAAVLTRVAGALLKTYHVKPAMDALAVAQDIYERHDQLGGLAEVAAFLGVGHHLTGDRQVAEQCFVEAMKLNRALGRKVRLADSCANLANLYWAGGRMADAEVLYRRALALFIEEQRQEEARRVRQLLDDLTLS